MPITADRVKETSTSTGTGNITLNGAEAQFRAFQDVFSVGAVVQCAIIEQSGTDWEIVVGTLTSATTISRDKVRSSSNGNALVNFGSGTKYVFATATAEHLDNASLGMQMAQSNGQAMP